MQIDIMSSARDIDPERLKGSVAVVIDVLRATSVMVTAFANGAKEIIAVSSPDEAFRLKESIPECLLGGEKDAVFIPGFDLDNSPFNYTSEVVAGKTIVMSTSNGTRAINGSLNADRILIGSFLNAKSVINEIASSEKVVLVCSGSNNQFTLEDALCSGYMCNLLLETNPAAKLSDLAMVMAELYLVHKNSLIEFASKGNHYQILLKKDFSNDLEYCFSHDLLHVVPRMTNGRLVIN